MKERCSCNGKCGDKCRCKNEGSMERRNMEDKKNIGHCVRIPDTRPHQFRNLVPTYSGNLSPVIPETCPHLI
jgi:hypothetical protein